MCRLRAPTELTEGSAHATERPTCLGVPIDLRADDSREYDLNTYSSSLLKKKKKKNRV